MRSVIVAMLVMGTCVAAEPSAAERGHKALTTTAFIAPVWRDKAYDSAWTHWGIDKKPEKYEEAFRERYGLHPAPYPNDGLPMGLRKAKFLFVDGLAVDCMMCHGSSIMGKSYIGLGNASLDVHAVFSDLNAADGRSPRLPFTFSNVRGTSEAGGFGVYLLGFREPDLKLKFDRKDLGLHDDLCEDVPAWWVLHKKKTMYHTGGADARSVRSKMQFMMTPLTTPADFARHEPAFRDVHEYLMSLRAPKYPFAIDTALAAQGEKVFRANCSSCHGTYGDKWTYPNKIVPLDDIGTDPHRFRGIEDKYGHYYNETWFAKEARPDGQVGYPFTASEGYQAPPLDGIWATAPYLHNGSVPTLYHLLKSSERPTHYTRSFRTDEVDYDKKNIGWKTTNIDPTAKKDLAPFEARKIYDTSRPGRSNKGHTYGDRLSDADRWALIEYLKTL